jgi:lipopolysaccharide export system permease protein
LNLIDRYIFRSVFATCLGAIALFAFIVIVPNIARDLLTHVLAGNISAFTFAKLVLLLVPLAITYALPMGMLTGVLLTLGRLSADSEITAMRAAGISVKRASRPVIFLALLGVALGLYFNFESMPKARVEYHQVFAATIRSNPVAIIVPRTFIRDFSGCVVYIGSKEGAVVHDIWVWQLDSERRVKRLIRADSGRIDYDEKTNSLVPTLLVAKSEERNQKSPEDFTEATTVATAERLEDLRLPLDRFFGPGVKVHLKQEWMTFSEIQQERARLAALPIPADKAEAKAAARERMKLELVYQDKFNTSLAVLSLALIGVPLGIKVSRRETSANFGVAVVLTLAYYLMTMAVKVLDRHPEYRPDLLLWLPNIILICVGAWMLNRVGRK